MKCGPWSKDCSISFEILKINIEKFFFIHFYNIIILLQFFPIKKTIVSHYCYKYWKKKIWTTSIMCNFSILNLNSYDSALTLETKHSTTHS